MRSKLVSILALALTMTPLCADEPAKPEAVEMFERLVQRLPPETDLKDVHDYIGKERTWVLYSSNADRKAVELTSFWISGQLYCIHRVRTERPTIAVYQIIEPDLESEPFSVIGQKVYSPNVRKKVPGSARVLDLYAAIDHGAKFAPNQLKFKKIYPAPLQYR